MGISESIKSIREKKRIKQVELADLLNLAPSYYSRLEKRGEKMTIEQLQSIADALGVSIGELLGIEGKGGANDGERVKELEKRVNELEELTNLHRERYVRLMDNVNVHAWFLINKFKREMTIKAFEEGLLNEENTKGFYVMLKDEGGNFQDFELADELVYNYDPDVFYFSSILSELEITRLMRHLPDELINELIFVDTGFPIQDKKIKGALTFLRSKTGL
jgi:transcriptional regulator with XRE-family HTH domain